MSTNRATPWTKAQSSADGANCVEQRRYDDTIELRDSKDREGPVLRFTPAEFAAWLDGAKKGEFDGLLTD